MPEGHVLSAVRLVTVVAWMFLLAFCMRFQLGRGGPGPLREREREPGAPPSG